MKVELAPKKTTGIDHKSPYRRRGRGPVALGAMLPRIAGRALRRRGFAEAAIITNWAAIVGDVLARETIPQKLAFPRGENTGGTLHVRVSGAFSTELQHLAPLVTEKINAYFGYAAVAKLAMKQGPITRARAEPRRKSAPPLSGPHSPELVKILSQIDDKDLRASLTRLGSILGKETD
jgi:hypothetical protein